VDTLTASRALTQLEAAGLLHRSEQRRGPGVYYTLAETASTPQTTPQITYQSVAKTVQELLRVLAEGKRLPQAKMDDLLVGLCAEQPFKAHELSRIVRRNPRYLTDAYLSRLVTEGRLQRSGEPNDPNVTYKTVSNNSKH